MVRVTKLELHRTISDIMKKGDLDQLTTKKIRLLCEQKYSVDLTSRKEEIDRIVMAFVTKQSGNNQNTEKEKNDASGEESDSPESDEESSGSSSSSSSESCSDSECSDSSDAEPKKPMNKEQSPPKPVPIPKKVAIKNANASKKVGSPPAKKIAVANSAAKSIKKGNTSKKAELDDAAYARQLQAEEWNFRQRTVKKLFRNTPHKKDVKNEQTKKKKTTPFMKKCLLSPALAEVIGANEMSRPDVVQKMWSVVRERNLFDPSNKQYAICDDQLMEIFGKKRVRLIGMMKYLKKRIRDKDSK